MPEETVRYNFEANTQDGKVKVEAFEKALSQTGETGKQAFDKSKAAAKSFSDTLKGVGESVSAAGKTMSMALSIPLAGFEAAIIGSAKTVKAGMNEIRIATGATGQELEGLKDSFKNVYGTVEADSETVGKAMGDLNVRLGLTGDSLEKLSEQMINLSKITHTDINTVVQASTRLFASWNVASKEYGSTLDFLFRVTQKSGVGFARLNELLTAFGPGLREMGFGLQQSAVLLGQFEKAGVNTELVMGALRVAVKNLSKAGEEPAQTFKRLVATIKELDTIPAMQLGQKIFGRGAVDIVTSIKAGRFEIDALTKSIQGSTDTINDAEEQTQTFGERMEILKHQVELALEPLGKQFIEITKKQFLPAIQEAVKWLTDLGKSFQAMPGWAQTGALGIVGVATAAGPLVLVIGKMISGLGLAWTSLVKFGQMLAGISATTWVSVGVIGALAIALWELQKALTAWYEASLQAGVAQETAGSRVSELAARIASIDKDFAVAATDLNRQFQQGAIDLGTYQSKMAGLEASSRKLHPELWKVKENTVAAGKAAGFTAEELKKLMGGHDAAAAAAKKHAEELKAWAAGIGVVTEKLNEHLINGQKLVAEWTKQEKAVGTYTMVIKSETGAFKDVTVKMVDLTNASPKLKDAYNKLSEATLKYVAQTLQLPQLLNRVAYEADNLNGILLDGEDIWTQQIKNTYDFIGAMDRLNIGPKFIDPLMEATNTLHKFGIQTNEELRLTAAAAQTAYEKILSTTGTTMRERELMHAKAIQSQIDLEKSMTGVVNQEAQAQVDAIKNKYGEMGNETNKEAKKMSEAWGQQVSTIVTDFSKGVADMIFEGKNFGETMIGIFSNFGKSIMRLLLEGIFSPMMKMFQDLGKGIGSALSGKGFSMGGAGGAGGGFNLLGMIGGMMPMVGAGLGGMAGGALSGGSKAGSTIGAAGTGIFGSALGGVLSAGYTAGSFGLGTITSTLAAIPVYGWIALAASLLAPILINVFKKNPFKSASKEIARDFGGIGMDDKQMQDWVQSSLGLGKDQFKGIRKDILSSPKFLTEVAFPMAQAQGKTEEFLKSLETVGTSWGVFNFRKAFEIGQLTGDFSQLNKEFDDAFGKSQALVSTLPDWQAKLAAVNTEGSAMWTTFQGLFAEFQQSGKITDEFAKSIKEVGLDLKVFQDATEIPGLVKMQAGFQGISQAMGQADQAAQDMYQTFIATGQITEELATAIEKAGGKVATFQAYSDAKKNLDDFQAGLGGLIEALNQATPASQNMIDAFTQLHIITPELQDQITKFGLDLGDFQNYAQLGALNDSFAALVQNFNYSAQAIENMTPIFEQFGGDLAALNDAANIPGLRGLQSDIDNLLSSVTQMLPKVDDWKTSFLESGIITDELAAKILAAGGNLEIFKQYANFIQETKQLKDLSDAFDTAGKSWAQLDVTKQQALENLIRTAGGEQANILFDAGDYAGAIKAAQDFIASSQQTVLAALQTELQKMSDALGLQIANLQKGLEDALALVQKNMADVYDAARLAIVDQLTLVQSGLTDTYNSAKDAVVAELQTMDGNLTTAIGNLQTALTDAINSIAGTGQGAETPTPGSGGSSNSNAKSTPPAANTPPGGKGAPVVHQTININGSVDDPIALRRNMDRVNRNLVDGLTR